MGKLINNYISVKVETKPVSWDKNKPLAEYVSVTNEQKRTILKYWASRSASDQKYGKNDVDI